MCMHANAKFSKIYVLAPRAETILFSTLHLALHAGLVQCLHYLIELGTMMRKSLPLTIRPCSSSRLLPLLQIAIDPSRLQSARIDEVDLTGQIQGQDEYEA